MEQDFSYEYKKLADVRGKPYAKRQAQLSRPKQERIEAV